MAVELAKIEERIDRTAAGAVAISNEIGGIRFQTMLEVMEFAKMMAVSGNAVPKHLQGAPGMCLAVCVQALEWRFSPFAVANKSYEVQGRLSFESQLVHAVIEQRAPITGRLQHRFEGEGDERRCIVWAALKENGERLEYISPPIGKITPKNSPLWKTKPDLQLYYNTSRDFCRIYFPDVLLGVYAADELEHGPDSARDVNPRPSVADRLKGSKQRGFNQGHVERETTRSVVDETGNREGGANQEPQSNSTAEPENSKTETPEQQGVVAAAPAPASDAPSPTPPSDAGNNTESPPPHEPGGDDGAASLRQERSDAAPSLPEGWERQYANALKRAQKPESLKKFAAQFWALHGGWDAHKDGPNADAAKAIFKCFTDHFTNREDRDAILHELGAA